MTDSERIAELIEDKAARDAVMRGLYDAWIDAMFEEMYAEQQAACQHDT